MKKKYVKPLIMIDNFQLDSCIATACGCVEVGSWFELNSADPNSCTATEHTTYDGIKTGYFLGSNELCSAEHEYYCYTNGSGNMIMFSKS